MTRRPLLLTIATVVLSLASSIHADVKTQHKTSFQLGGTLGAIANRFAGDAAKDGIVQTMALKGNRQMNTGPQAGQIIDITEEKVYDLDLRKKEYRVTTFAQLRKQWQDAQKEMQKDMKNAQGDQPADPKESGKQVEISVSVKETGQSKAVAGHNTRQVIMTITMHEKGKTLEDGGGLVLTSDMWMAPKIAALDEIADFHLKYAKAIYGDTFMGADMQQMGMAIAQYPSFKEMSERMAAEGKKLQGTPLATTVTLEAVRSAAEMSAAPAAPAASSGGGLMGRLANRMAPKPKPTEARSKVFTSTDEMLSIAMAVDAADLAVPAGFKEKK